MSPETTELLTASISTDLQTMLERASQLQACTTTEFIVCALQNAAQHVIQQAENVSPPVEPLIPNATTVQAIKEARAGEVTEAASVDALFQDLRSDTDS